MLCHGGKRSKKEKEGKERGGRRERREEEEEEENECTFFNRSLFNQPLPTFLFLLLSTILSLFFPLFTRASQGEGTRGYEKADVRRMQMNTVRGNDQLFHSVLLMFARCGFAVHAFWIFAGWNGFRGGSLFGKKFGEEWSHSRSLVEFFFFLERLERIVSFLFFVHLLSFVVVRINVEFVKLTVEYGYCVLVSLEINLFIIRGLF